MKDIDIYQPPFSLLGKVAITLIIRNKLEELFQYRTKAIEAIFEA